MATTGIVGGTLIALYSGGVMVAHLTSNSQSSSLSLRDISTKTSGGKKESAASQFSWSMGCEGYFAEGPTFGFVDLFTAQKAGTALVVMTSSQVTGDKKYTGTAFVTSLEKSHGNNETSTFTCTLEGTGDLVEAAV